MVTFNYPARYTRGASGLFFEMVRQTDRSTQPIECTTWTTKTMNVYTAEI